MSMPGARRSCVTNRHKFWCPGTSKNEKIFKVCPCPHHVTSVAWTCVTFSFFPCGPSPYLNLSPHIFFILSCLIRCQPTLFQFSLQFFSLKYSKFKLIHNAFLVSSRNSSSTLAFSSQVSVLYYCFLFFVRV